MGAAESIGSQCSEVVHGEQHRSAVASPSSSASSPSKRLAAARATGLHETWHVTMRHSDACQDLFDAAVRGDTKAAMLALVAQAEPNSCNADGLTPLMMAVAGGHMEVAKLLITSGTKINATPCRWGLSALGLAAAQGHVPLTELLLQWKADTNVCAPTGNAPLSRAAASGHTQVCTALLEYCADPDACDAAGVTAMMLATEREHAEVVKLFLKCRASMMKVDHRCRSALSRVLDVLLHIDPQATRMLSGVMDPISRYDTWTEISRTMAELNADTNLADLSGETLLSRAIRHRRKDLVMLLLGLGADKDFPVPSLGGGTALLQGLKERDHDLVQCLVMRAASVNHAMADGLSPVFLAVDGGDEELVFFLLKMNAEVRRRDPRTGESLLMRAAARGLHSVYRQLLPLSVVSAVNQTGDVIATTTRTTAGETDEGSEDLGTLRSDAS